MPIFSDLTQTEHPLTEIQQLSQDETKILKNYGKLVNATKSVSEAHRVAIKPTKSINML